MRNVFILWTTTGRIEPRKSGRRMESGAILGPLERLQLRLLVYKRPLAMDSELKVRIPR